MATFETSGPAASCNCCGGGSSNTRDWTARRPGPTATSSGLKRSSPSRRLAVSFGGADRQAVEVGGGPAGFGGEEPVAGPVREVETGGWRLEVGGIWTAVEVRFLACGPSPVLLPSREGRECAELPRDARGAGVAP